MSGSKSIPSGSRLNGSHGVCLSPTYTSNWLFSKSLLLAILSNSIKPWPMTMRVCCMDTAVFALMNRAPNSASAADDMTAWIIWEMFRTAPLLMGISSLLAMNIEHVTTSLDAGFWFGEVRRIAVDPKDHFARAVCEYCFFLHGHKIQKNLTQFYCFFHRVCLLGSK
jgi:hypothetical protein